ncbi:extracellular calcium-sensing receptor-like [Hyla sarda]|uniref:extracellular calcium-sensing receptor-like n=1 Tax=Hyla sarda TaxID=327740 RepID=UPI0024C2B8F4|nr:extracellular calcium-sensing receptor-like [Hyla sarda]
MFLRPLLSMWLRFYIFILWSLVSPGRSIPCNLRGKQEAAFSRDGDLIIGGYFPVHVSYIDPSYSFRERDHQITCNVYSASYYILLHAMVYAIEEINADKFLLPNITLGFQLFDTCIHLSRALWATFITLTGEDNPIPNYQCNKKVPLAIIGDPISLLSIAMATILGVYRYPQVSYAASVNLLSDRYLFPSFFRTVSSDAKQSVALAGMVSFMGWKWVGLLSLNNDYGIQGSQILKEELQKLGVCIAYHETFGQETSLAKLQSIAKVIVQSSAKVIILFSRDPHIHQLMELLLQKKDVERIWVASNGWSTSPILSIPKYSHLLAGTIGYIVHEVNVLGFKEYFLGLRASTLLPQDIFIKDFWELVLGCRWPSGGSSGDNKTLWCTGEENLKLLYTRSYDSNNFNFRMPYFIYSAVYSLAHAIHNLIFPCALDQESPTHKICGDLTSIKPWQGDKLTERIVSELSKKAKRKANVQNRVSEGNPNTKPKSQNQVFHRLKSVYFRSRMGEEMFYDVNGDPPTDYDLLNWHRNSDGAITFVTVGRYRLGQAKENELSINSTAIRWITGGNEIPRSVCSESCSPGFRKAAKEGQPMCCYDCVPCADGEISNQTDSSNCFPCTEETLPNANKTICLPKEIEYLSYGEPLAITLTSSAIFFSFTTIGVLFTFVKYKDTAIVKANNSDLSYGLLASLSLSFLCSLLFIGEPERLACLLRQTAFGVIFVICVSCIFAKTLMVVIAFRATKPGSNMRKWLGPKVPAVVIVICASIQVFICVSWIRLCPPFPEKNYKIKAEVIIYQCNECSDVFLWSMLGYMAFLACVSFIVAFLARNLPDTFNEAKWITFSMLIFLNVWISFVPAYLSTQGKFMVAIEVFGIIFSSAGILGCFFFPKCYIILFRPDLNTRGILLGKSTSQRTKN